jgi:2-oxoglutarate ferredoxin oxidoreductase subunit gamma
VDREVYKILIAGEGGQGIQALAHVFVRAAFDAGLNVVYLPNFGVEQRGGVSLGFLQIGRGEIGFPKFDKADIIINMRDRAIDRVNEYVGDKTLYIYDSDLITGSQLRDVAAEKLAVPATSKAAEKLTPQVFNMILAGALLTELPILSRKFVDESLEQQFALKYKKKPQLRNLNKKAIDLGEKLAKEAFAPKK